MFVYYKTLSREHMNSQLTLLPVCGFIAQLVEHRTGNAEVTGSNPVEALNFFQASMQLLKLQTQLRGSFLHFTKTVIAIAGFTLFLVTKCIR